VPDDCDIADGSSVDANGDGFPDECFAPICVADLDKDGMVGASDLSLLLASWGAVGAAADLDGDGDVGASDLSLLLAAWGGC
jgi:hypothetical protein